MLPLLAGPVLAQEPPKAPDPTEDLFVRKCASCHTVGKGVRVGPDLKGAHERRAKGWLASFIKAPSGLLDTDADARQLLAAANGVRMPDLGLSDAQVADLVALIRRCSSQACELAGKVVPVTQATVADVDRGRQFFLGARALSAGAIPCLSCHTVRGTGSVVPGGSLAKDLTNVFARLGDDGLDAALKSPAFPAMNKIFQEHPLAPEEVFALRAFLYDSNRRESPKDETVHPTLAAVVGTAAVLVVLNAAWARRMRGIRKALTGGTEKRT